MALYQTNPGDRILSADINQFYAILKGVAASGETITLVYNNQSLIFQPSSDPAAGTRCVLVKNNAGTVLSTWRYDGTLELLSAAAAPATPVTGSVYWDTALAALRVYDGVAWNNAAGLSTTAADSGIGRWLWDWDGKATIESTLVGTGTYTIASPLLTYVSFLTGATSGGSSAGRVQLGSAGAGFNGVGKLRLAKLQFQHGHIDANTNSIVYITDESVVGNPSSTARHFGFRQSGAIIYFSTADNANEQTTDITAFVTAGTDNFYDITFDGTTARCYVNGTLRATHATYVPAPTASAQPNFRTYIVNSAAATKALYFTKVHLVFAV